MHESSIAACMEQVSKLKEAMRELCAKADRSWMSEESVEGLKCIYDAVWDFEDEILSDMAMVNKKNR